jgi:hypothetical protein
MVDNGYLLCFRWLELLEEPRKDSGQVSPVVPSNRHRHLQIWPRLWPGKQSFLTNLYKLKWATSISNHEAEVNSCQPVTRTFSALNLHYSIRQMSLWTQTLGFEPLSPSSPYYQLHVQMRIRCSLQPSNSEALPVYGGISFMLCNLPIMSSPGTNFGRRFTRITYRKDSLSESLMNF